MALEYEEKSREAQKNAVDEEPPAPDSSPPSTAPPQCPETVNGSPEQAATGTSAPVRMILPMRRATTLPASINILSASPSSEGWELLNAVPSLTTSASSVKTAIQDNEPPEPDDAELCELTQSTLSLFNKNNEHIGAKASMEAKKGSATRASDDSVEAFGPYAPADGDTDSLFAAAGSWQDETPRGATALEDELDRM